MYLLNKQTNKKKKQNKFNKADLTKRKRAIMEIANRSTQGFPGGSTGKESACNAGDLNSIPGLGRYPRGGHGNPLQYSYLEMDRGAWWATVHGIAKSQAQLSN